MKRYRQLFSIPNVWVLVLAAFPARVAYGMVGLSLFFKAQQETGSIAIAGLVIGANSLAGSFTAGIRGSVIDKYGQKWPLRILVPGYATMMIVVNASHSSHVIVAMAILMGLTAPPINLSVRPLWKTIVPPDFLRTAYAVDSSVMNTAGVIGPVIATSLALSKHPGTPLITAAVLMSIGGGALAIAPVSRDWKPEKKEKGAASLWNNPALRLMMLEGSFIGFGWGLFDVAVPAYATLENVAHRTAWVFAAMGISSIIGGLVAGLISKRTSSLRALRRTYLMWFLVAIPMAFTYPGWSMAIAGACLGFVGGAIQVFYWEVMEAVRPKGSAVSYMAWLWTVEGSVMSLGAAVGGILSDNVSPQFCLALTAVSIGMGNVVLTIGKKRLIAADRIPTEEEDTAAMEGIAPTTS
ncbi:MAG: MFS transporter [Actinobacteria bacterium]|nr:MFS transporter [Actinomycetota bacterium]MSZ06168.1 MFS transporter [Actinomycetota bacterium]